MKKVFFIGSSRIFAGTRINRSSYPDKRDPKFFVTVMVTEQQNIADAKRPRRGFGKISFGQDFSAT